jgi:hypothetical protein
LNLEDLEAERLGNFISSNYSKIKGNINLDVERVGKAFELMFADHMAEAYESNIDRNLELELREERLVGRLAGSVELDKVSHVSHVSHSSHTFTGLAIDAVTGQTGDVIYAEQFPVTEEEKDRMILWEMRRREEEEIERRREENGGGLRRTIVNDGKGGNEVRMM